MGSGPATGRGTGQVAWQICGSLRTGNPTAQVAAFRSIQFGRGSTGGRLITDSREATAGEAIVRLSTEWSSILSRYENSGPSNEEVYKDFTRGTNDTPFLSAHRGMIEANMWGFGDRAFHYMWYLCIASLARRRGTQRLNLLEIGVYMGQVVSLWCVISRHLGVCCEVVGVSPLRGNQDRSKLLNAAKWLLSRAYRRLRQTGNVYECLDYASAIRRTLVASDVPEDGVRLVRGLSQDPAVLAQLDGTGFWDLVYVDGDHTYEGVLQDIRNAGPRIRSGGYLVVDDASCFIPGEGYFKGHNEVSRATEDGTRELRLKNVLNVGHNRVFCVQEV